MASKQVRLGPCGSDLILAGCLCLALTCSPRPQPARSLAPGFRRDIRPILRASCRCHIDNPSPPSGLDLSDYPALARGGRSGPGIVPGKPDSSPIFLRVARGEMPPTGRLAPADSQLIRRWIESGASGN
ncbi:MAG: c-type cytochrome domain-containing protein [candidate division WOR-3 bacterium]